MSRKCQAHSSRRTPVGSPARPARRRRPATCSSPSRERERGRVDPQRVVVLRHEGDGHVAGDGVERLLRRLRGRRPFAAPPAEAAQPASRGHLADRRGDARQRVVQRLRALEPDLSLGERPRGEVDVRVGEAREHAAPAEVDAVGARRARSRASRPRRRCARRRSRGRPPVGSDGSSVRTTPFSRITVRTIVKRRRPRGRQGGLRGRLAGAGLARTGRQSFAARGRSVRSLSARTCPGSAGRSPGRACRRSDHVLVGLAEERVRLVVVAGGVGVERALQLHDVLGHALLQGGLGEPGRLGEEAGEGAGVAGQVVDRLGLARLVALGERDRVVDEEPDVVAPQARPVEERLGGLVAVDGADRLRDLDRVARRAPPAMPRSRRRRRAPSAWRALPGSRAPRTAGRASRAGRTPSQSPARAGTCPATARRCRPRARHPRRTSGHTPRG